MNSVLNSYHNFAQWIVPWLVGLTVATAIVASSGSQPTAVLVFLVCLPLCFSTGQPVIKISGLWLFIFTWPLVASIPLFIGSETGEALSAASRYFITAIILIGLSQLRLSSKILLRAASASGMLAILFNVDQLGEMRVNFGVGFLDAAYIGVLLLGLTLAQYHLDKGRPWWRVYGLVGIACLVVVVMKTGTRGAWPAMICVFLIQLVLVDLPLKRKVFAAFAGLVLFGIVLFTVPSIKNRIDLTVYEFQSYYQENNHASSMGYRFDFWQIALECFAESPIWGVSYQRRSEIMEQYVKKNPVSASIGNDGRSSSHNEILNALAKKGLLGVLAVFLLYLVPMRFFLRHLRSNNTAEIRHLGLAGTGMVISIIICGVTEAPMMSVRVGTSYGIFIVFLYHLITASIQENTKAAPSV